jgi:xanthine dehydrogenase YagR molybdenum-binding subunit
MAQIRIHRDGTVEALIGTQDIGGGARTVVAIITSREFGHLALEKIRARIGDSELPASGASAGSSTTRGVENELRQAARNVRAKLFELAAEKLEVSADQLEIRDGGVVAQRNGAKKLTWQEATSLIKDSILGHERSIVEPGYQWALCRDDGTVEQANEENYRA